MTATEELRRMLDERGVEYYASPNGVAWGKLATPIHGRMYTHYAVELDGLLCVDSHCITPEQAIAATLGAEDKVYAVGGIIAQAECHDVCSSVAEFTCSACGFNCDITSWVSLFDGDVGRHRHHHHGTPNFCPNCGRKVVDE